jgi:hypothetical protein
MGIRWSVVHAYIVLGKEVQNLTQSSEQTFSVMWGEGGEEHEFFCELDMHVSVMSVA